MSWSDRKGSKRGLAAGAAVAAIALAVAGQPGTARAQQASATHSAPVAVIVSAQSGGTAGLTAAVRAVGGQVTRVLAGAVAADVPAEAVAGLRRAPGVASVATDHAAVLDGARWQNSTAIVTPSLLQQTTGATAYWSKGYYGQGVGVALLDSGVTPVDGLRYRVVNGPDFTPESQDPTKANIDGYGHGTFMAGLIAGAREGAQAPYVGDPNDVGIAPQSTIVNVRVADSQGNTSESSVIAGIDWTIQHRNDNGLNIRVMNLSLSVPNTSSYLFSPLAAAVERAWAAGIVVVASAGNDGGFQLTLPAADPFVIAVGAADTKGTVPTADDSVAGFSDASWAKWLRHPDLIAPGTHMESLRDPGSTIDQAYGATAATTDGLFLGTGTSEATAVTSGAAALVLSANPSLTPDQVKWLLVKNTAPLKGWPKTFAGHGELSLTGALNGDVSNRPQVFWHALNWLQSIADFSGGTWSSASWTGTSWTSASWTSASWTSASWTSASWTSASWTSASWTSASWTTDGWN